MSKDLFQGDFILSTTEKITAMGKLDILHGEHLHCSACDSGVDVSFLRKHRDTPLHEAVCLPCFLNNFTNETQEDIDRVVGIANSQGWYKD